MSEAPLNGVPGWYGKLPNLGDFASRRLPQSFITGWDEWLQSGLAAARDEWGPEWLDRYLVAPIVRFWLGPGVLGDGAWAGLVMPSVDRVGRHFPLTLAQPAGTLADALAARQWFELLDAAARRVLDVAYTVEAFEDDLAGLAADGATASDDDVRLAESVLCEGLRRSAWWCGDGEHLQGFDALPSAREFASLLGGSM
jgi:type VI secretion system protein ImpM